MADYILTHGQADILLSNIVIFLLCGLSLSRFNPYHRVAALITCVATQDSCQGHDQQSKLDGYFKYRGRQRAGDHEQAFTTLDQSVAGHRDRLATRQDHLAARSRTSDGRRHPVASDHSRRLV